MRHVANLFLVTQSDPIAEVVGDYAQVITVIPDIGREIGLVSPADYTLLDPSGRSPVNFQLQLVRLDQTWRFRKFTQLCEEKDEPMGASTIVSKLPPCVT